MSSPRIAAAAFALFARTSMKPPPPIIVTTNFDEHELVTKMATASDGSIATATMSRIWEMTEKLVMDGPDRRLT